MFNVGIKYEKYYKIKYNIRECARHFFTHAVLQKQNTAVVTRSLMSCPTRAFHTKETSFPGIKERKLLSILAAKPSYITCRVLLGFFPDTHRHTHMHTLCAFNSKS